MKTKLILLLGTVLFMSACSNDLKLTAPWKKIPIVYGFLNISDTAQYIRVEKAFLDPNVSALTIAQNPDSIYFDNIEVSLTRLSTNKTWVLTRVNGNTEGYPKKPGTFANDPNYLYKIKTSLIDLKPDETYKLSIKEIDSGNIIGESQTQVVGNYAMVTTEPPNPMGWPYFSDVRFSWRSSEKSGRLCDIKLKLHYTENSVAEPTKFTAKTLDWKIGENIERPIDVTARITAAVKGEEFFKFLAANLEKNGALKRQFQTLDVNVVIGGKEFTEYISLGNASSGITSAQIVPTYSNITKGVGIFSSRSYLVAVNYAINASSRDSLKNGIHTKDLNFQ